MSDDALVTNLPDIIPRLPNESAQAYEALCFYAQMGPERSLVAVGQKVGKSKALIERWSAHHAWVRRVRQFDAWVAAAAQASYLDTAAAIANGHAHEAADLRARALARLHAVPLDTLPPAIALKLWVEAIRIERLSLGLPTDTTHATAQMQANVQAQVNTTVSYDWEAERDAQVALFVHDAKARELATALFDRLMMGDYGDDDDALDDTAAGPGENEADARGVNTTDTPAADEATDDDLEGDA